MGIAARLLLTAVVFVRAVELRADPPATKSQSQNRSEAAIIESANGWMFVNGEWVHPDGYKLVNHKILRTTAKPGQPLPKSPGKLALDNPAKLKTRTNSRVSAADQKAAAEKRVDVRRKNLTPIPAPQTGTHL